MLMLMEVRVNHFSSDADLICDWIHLHLGLDLVMNLHHHHSHWALKVQVPRVDVPFAQYCTNDIKSRK